MNMSVPYKQFWSQVKVKVSGILLAAGVAAFFAYEASGSVFLCVSIFVLAILALRVFFGGRLAGRRSQVARVFGDRFQTAERTPIDERSDLEWLKGIGYISDTAQPVWVKVSDEGVNLYYLSRSRIPPVIVGWSDIDRVHILRREESGGVANLFIHGIDDRVYIPWSASFSQHVPESVGISYEK